MKYERVYLMAYDRTRLQGSEIGIGNWTGISPLAGANSSPCVDMLYGADIASGNADAIACGQYRRHTGEGFANPEAHLTSPRIHQRRATPLWRVFHHRRRQQGVQGTKDQTAQSNAADEPLVGARFKPKVNEINIVTRVTVEDRGAAPTICEKSSATQTAIKFVLTLGSTSYGDDYALFVCF